MTLQPRGIIGTLARGISRTLSSLRRISIFLLVLAMFALNIASFAFENVGALFNSLADSIFRTSWVVDMNESMTEIRSRSRKLDVENDRLRKELVESEERNRRLESRLTKASAALKKQADEVSEARKLRSQFDEVSEKISRRVSRGAARNIASIPLESTPFVGALTVTVITAAEVYDACQTFEEMQELRALAGFDRLENIMEKTCNFVPFVGGAVNVKDMSVAECFDHARSLLEIDIVASEILTKKCECIQANPGREAICFPESTLTDSTDAPSSGKPDRL